MEVEVEVVAVGEAEAEVAESLLVQATKLQLHMVLARHQLLGSVSIKLKRLKSSFLSHFGGSS